MLAFSSYRSSSLRLPLTASQIHHIQFTNTDVVFTICTGLKGNLNPFKVKFSYNKKVVFMKIRMNSSISQFSNKECTLFV